MGNLLGTYLIEGFSLRVGFVTRGYLLLSWRSTQERAQ